MSTLDNNFNCLTEREKYNPYLNDEFCAYMFVSVCE